MSKILPTTITTRTGQSITIRSAQPEDAARLIVYLRTVLRESPHFLMEPDDFRLTEAQERRWIQDHLDGPSQLAIVAETADEIVGSLSFENSVPRRLTHRGSLGVSVRQTRRGQGIGTALLQTLIDWAQASPLIEKIGLSVFATNVDAIRLYQRLGFVEEGRQPHEIKLAEGQYVDNVLMYRLV